MLICQEKNMLTVYKDIPVGADWSFSTELTPLGYPCWITKILWECSFLVNCWCFQIYMPNIHGFTALNTTLATLYVCERYPDIWFPISSVMEGCTLPNPLNQVSNSDKPTSYPTSNVNIIQHSTLVQLITALVNVNQC